MTALHPMILPCRSQGQVCRLTGEAEPLARRQGAAESHPPPAPGAGHSPAPWENVMAPDLTNSASSADQCVRRIQSWWHDGGLERSVEFLGTAGSGKTEVLLRLRDALPDPVWVDATGFTAEEILGKTLDAFEVPDLWSRRVDWVRELKRAGVGSRPPIITDSQRAGRTRQSIPTQPIRQTRAGPAGGGCMSQGDRRIAPRGSLAAGLADPPSGSISGPTTWPWCCT